MSARETKAVLRELAERRITRAQAAKRLGGISVRQVNRLMSKHGVTRAPGRSRERRIEAQLRREAKQRAANGVVRGVYDVRYAANIVGCSQRTMYRWVARLRKAAISARKRRKVKQS